MLDGDASVFLREGETYAALYRTLSLAESGETHLVAQLYRESLPIFASLGLEWGLVQCLEGLACLADEASKDESRQDGSRLERAVRLWSPAQSIRAMIGAQVPPVDTPRFNRFVSGLRRLIDASCFEVARQTGRALTREQILQDAFAA